MLLQLKGPHRLGWMFHTEKVIRQLGLLTQTPLMQIALLL
jgi:hypothetical protein